jgi:hypothetical protein
MNDRQEAQVLLASADQWPSVSLLARMSRLTATM